MTVRKPSKIQTVLQLDEPHGRGADGYMGARLTNLSYFSLSVGAPPAHEPASCNLLGTPPVAPQHLQPPADVHKHGAAENSGTQHVRSFPAAVRQVAVRLLVPAPRPSPRVLSAARALPHSYMPGPV